MKKLFFSVILSFTIFLTGCNQITGKFPEKTIDTFEKTKKKVQEKKILQLRKKKLSKVSSMMKMIWLYFFLIKVGLQQTKKTNI